MALKILILLLLATPLGLDTYRELEIEQHRIISEIIELHQDLCMVEMKIKLLGDLK
jgi:hypothetical protein